MFHSKRALATGIFLATAALSHNSLAFELGSFGDTDFTFKGYLKMDVIYSDYSDGSLGAGSIGRDFYIPSLTPVEGDGASEDAAVDFHMRQSRFAWGTTTNVDEGTLKTYVELDFIVTPDGNERISNSWEPRMRHAFITYNKWLFGQTWNTSMDVSSLPETLDFIGNTDAGLFGRQPMIRYTDGPWQFAIENPESTITPFGGGGRIVTDDNSLPEFVARYNHKFDGGHVTVVGLVRQLAYNNGDDIDDTENSFGVGITGSFSVGRDKIKYGINYGSGLGRLVGLNVTNGAVINADNELEAIDTVAYFASYQHWWNDKWRSNISYSAIDIDNDVDLTGAGATAETSSLRINLLCSPTKKLTMGGELAFAEREEESGASGDMTRLQLSAKLAF